MDLFWWCRFCLYARGSGNERERERGRGKKGRKEKKTLSFFSSRPFVGSLLVLVLSLSLLAKKKFESEKMNHHAQGKRKGLGCLVEGEAARAEGAEVASRRRRRRRSVPTTGTVAVDEVERGMAATVSRSRFLVFLSLLSRKRSASARVSSL